MKKMLILSIVMAMAGSGFAVVDDLAIGSVEGTNALELTWATDLAFNYTVENKTDLITENWATNTTLAGTGGNISVLIPVDPLQSFYRVLDSIIVLNFGFELGTVESWMVTGDAFLGQPVTTNWPSDGFVGTYLANSYYSTGGIPATGTLRSASFIVGSNDFVSILIGGWSAVGAAGTDFNYVTLNRASDDVELDRVYAPGITGTMVGRSLQHGQTTNEVVYVEVVDDEATSSLWGWLSVDDVLVLPNDTENFSFEARNFDEWTTTGNAWPSPVTTNWPSDGYEGQYLANSYWPVGPSTTGTLTSTTFLVGSNEFISILMGGHSEEGGDPTPATNFNYVTLNRASDNVELDRVWAPGITGTMVGRSLMHGQTTNIEVYVEVVDDSANAWAWLSVDDVLTLPYEYGNFSFESRNFDDWTTTGNAWLYPATADWPSSGFEGQYLASSFLPLGAGAIGTLTSTNFTLVADESVAFKAGGWSAEGAEGTNFCYVTLNRVSDDAELDRIWAPGITGVMQPRVLKHGQAGDVDVYLEVVDDSANAWAWISVDAFKSFVLDASFGSNTNGGFELGDWTDWTVSGTAFGSAPMDNGPQGRAGWTGRFYANSGAVGETNEGTLTSETFSLGTNDTVSFLVSGYSGWATASNDWNYVALKRASDDSEIDRAWAPNVTGTMLERSFTSATNIAENVYVEVVDDSTTNGYAWIAVDDFQIHTN